MSYASKSVSEILGLMRQEIEMIDWEALELSAEERTFEGHQRALMAAHRINLRCQHNERLEALAESLRRELSRLNASEEAMEMVAKALGALKGTRWGEDMRSWLAKMRVSPESMYWEQEDYHGVCAADLLNDPLAREALDRVMSRKKSDDY